jgi:hypothetical protein
MRGGSDRSGAEYLTVAAQQATEEPLGEHTSLFADLIRDGGLLPPPDPNAGDGPFGEALLEAEFAARRGLDLWEVEAMSVIGAAYDLAVADANPTAAREIQRDGMVLFARFEGYMETRGRGDPGP